MAIVTSGALTQSALNIIGTLQKSIQNGQYLDTYDTFIDICAAIIALANVQYAVNAAGTASQTIAVTVPTYAIGNQYSAVVVWPAAVVTGIR